MGEQDNTDDDEDDDDDATPFSLNRLVESGKFDMRCAVRN